MEDILNELKIDQLSDLLKVLLSKFEIVSEFNVFGLRSIKIQNTVPKEVCASSWELYGIPSWPILCTILLHPVALIFVVKKDKLVTFAIH